MKKNIIDILFISMVLFAINGCGTSEHFYPERTGKTTKVSTGEELYLAVINAEPWETIQLEDGEYILKQSLLIENKSHLTICSASADSSKVILQGDGWNDFYHRENKENDPSEPTNYEAGTLHNYDGIIRNNFITGGFAGGKGIEIVWADNIKVYSNTIWSSDTNYLAIHYFQKINRLSLSNNLVRGKISGEGNEVISEANLTGDMDGYFIDPEKGDLHLTKHAKKALRKGLQLPVLKDDIDRQKRGNYPDIGADQR